jgi:hypothetical protein
VVEEIVVVIVVVVVVVVVVVEVAEVVEVWSMHRLSPDTQAVQDSSRLLQVWNWKQRVTSALNVNQRQPTVELQFWRHWSAEAAALLERRIPSHSPPT